MWPLSGLEILDIVAGSVSAPASERDAALRALHQLRIAGVKADGAPPERDDLFVALREPDYDFDGHDWVEPYLRAGAALALVAADWPLLSALPVALRRRCIVVDDTLRALRQLAAWSRRRYGFPVIAVGGSNGKTTTKDMIAALLAAPGFRATRTQGNLNGCTGIPLTMLQREHTRAAPPQALVAEIGIDAPSAMARHAALLAPDVAVLTALGPEHLSGFSSWEQAAAEELLLFSAPSQPRRIFQTRDARLRQQLSTARRGDIVVCDEDLAQCEPLLRAGASILAFRVPNLAPLHSEIELTWYPDAAGAAWRGHVQLPMPGRHNADNFAAAFGAALAVSRSPDALLRGWPGFTPPPRRCQHFTLPHGALLIDDSYNASPSSMSAALALFDRRELRPRRKLLFLGDMLDLGAQSAHFHRALCEPLRSLKNARLFLFGAAMREVYRTLSATDDSVRWLPEDAEPRDFLSHLEIERESPVILIKGSRALRLDRVADAILRRASLPADELPRQSDGGRWQLQFVEKK